MNPYAVLGVHERATIAEIKDAWRKISRIHHPDRKGGDAAKMAECNQAYDILSDPLMRERWDLTGDATAPLPLDVDAKSCILQLISQAIMAPFEIDIFAVVRQSIIDTGNKATTAKAANRRQIADIKRKRKRLKIKGPSGAFVSDLFEQMLGQLVGHEATYDRQVEIANRALEIFDEACAASDPTGMFSQIQFSQSTTTWK